MKKITFLLSTLFFTLMSGVAYGTDGSPTVSNIATTPSDGITFSTTVAVSATVENYGHPLLAVILNWGTATDALVNQIPMSSLDLIYTTMANIPAQVNGTTVYYSIAVSCEEPELSLTSEIQSYTVEDPVTIVSQNFEDETSWGYTASPTTFNVNDDIWAIVDGEWKVQDLENNNGGTSSYGTLIFQSVDVSSYMDVVLSFDSKIEAFDIADVVKYQVFENGVGLDENLLTNASSGFSSDSSVVVSITPGVDVVYVILSVKQDGGSDQAFFDNFKVEGIVDPLAPKKPVIKDVLPEPGTVVKKDSIFVVSAVVVTDDGVIDSVCLATGEVSGSLEDTMSLYSDGDTIYSTSIPIGEEGTFYGQIIAYGSNGEVTYSPETNVVVIAPQMAILPYSEDFSTDLGQCYVYSIDGDNMVWVHATDVAYASGSGSGEDQEDWLILPGVDLDAYNNETLDFTTEYSSGLSDATNYLKLFYSTDYEGLDDPADASWIEISFVSPTAIEDETASGSIDISPIIGQKVYFAFKYLDDASSYRGWSVDNIEIDGVDTASQAPVIVDIQPADQETVTVGDIVNVTASLIVPGGGHGDSVLFVYGDPVIDSVAMYWVEVSSFWWIEVPTSMEGENYYRIKAYNNGEATTSDLRTLNCDFPIVVTDTLPEILIFLPEDDTEFEQDSSIIINAIVTTLDIAGIDSVCFVTEGEPFDTIKMTPTDDSYTTIISISITGTFSGRIVAFAGNGEITESDSHSITVVAPQMTALPYAEDLTDSLGTCYAYSVSGDSGEWYIEMSIDSAAAMNGNTSVGLEEDWLILPAIDLDRYQNEVFEFGTRFDLGSGDDNATDYFELMFSSDYRGVGDPNLATWSVMECDLPTVAQEIALLELEIDSIEGEAVYFAFKYHYTFGNYKVWSVAYLDISGIDTGSVVPIIFDIEPGDGELFTVGDTVNVVAMVGIPSGNLDSVLFVYGDPAIDSIRMIYLPDSGFYWLPVPVSQSGESVYRIIVYGNDDSVESPLRTLYSECGVVDIPTAEAATNVMITSFEANWNTVNADYYLLDVWMEDSATVPLTDLFISEFAEGSSYDKYFEIFNGTESAIDLSSYAFATVTNAPSVTGEFEYWNDFKDGAVVAPGGVYVVAHSSANESILAIADELSSKVSNGNDGLALVKVLGEDTIFIDWVGNFEGDPGSGWTVAGVSAATMDHTIIRKSDINAGNIWSVSVGTDAEDSEWMVLDIDNFDDLGRHTNEGLVYESYVMEDAIVGDVTSFLVTDLWPETDYFYSVKAVSELDCESDASETIMLTTVPMPMFSVSPTDLNFSSIQGQGASGIDSFTVSVSDIPIPITVSFPIPTNFQLFPTRGAVMPIGTSVSFEIFGSVDTTFYIRMNAGLSVSSYSEIIAIDTSFAFVLPDFGFKSTGLGILTQVENDYEIELNGEVFASSYGLDYVEDFEFGIPNDWIVYAEVGTELWDLRTDGDDNYPQISNDNSGDAASVSWLISPKVDIDAASNAIFTFDVNSGYNKDDDTLEVFYSEDFDGSDVNSAIWHPLTDQFSIPKTEDDWGIMATAGSTDVSFISASAYFAFKYIGVETTGTGFYQVDNFEVKQDMSTQVEKIIKDGVQVFSSQESIMVKTVGQQVLRVYDISGSQLVNVMMNTEAIIAVKQGVYFVRVADTVTKVVVK